MPSGIQIWDAAGNIQIDTSTYLLKTGFIDVGTVTSSGSTDISAIIAAGGTVIPVVAPNDAKPPAKITVSGSTLSWTNQSGQALNSHIMVMIP